MKTGCLWFSGHFPAKGCCSGWVDEDDDDADDDDGGLMRIASALESLRVQACGAGMGRCLKKEFGIRFHLGGPVLGDAYCGLRQLVTTAHSNMFRKLLGVLSVQSQCVTSSGLRITDGGLNASVKVARASTWESSPRTGISKHGVVCRERVTARGG